MNGSTKSIAFGSERRDRRRLMGMRNMTLLLAVSSLALGACGNDESLATS